MSVKEFSRLKYGAVVRWREGAKSPRAGELTDKGIVSKQYGVKSVLWEDGQVTDGSDDWALANIEAAEVLVSA